MTREFLPAGTAGIIEAAPAAAPAAIEADALVVFLTEGGVGSGGAAAVDAATGGLLARLAGDGELAGRRYECLSLFAPAGLKVGQLLVVGLGRGEEVDAGVIFKAAATAARHLAGRPRSRVAFLPEASWNTPWLEQAVAGGSVGMIGQDLYRAEPKRTRFGTTLWIGADAAAVARGTSIGDGVNLARRLVNASPDHIYPESFAEEAAAIAGRTGLEIEIWDEDRLRRERCEALLAVARGSSRPPRLVLLRYRGRQRASGDHPDLAFVGKGRGLEAPRRRGGSRRPG
jgi:leucyl aminopeptidase